MAAGVGPPCSVSRQSGNVDWNSGGVEMIERALQPAILNRRDGLARWFVRFIAMGFSFGWRLEAVNPLSNPGVGDFRSDSEGVAIERVVVSPEMWRAIYLIPPLFP